MKKKSFTIKPVHLTSWIIFPGLIFVLIFSTAFFLVNNYYISSFLDDRLEKEALRISQITYENRFLLNNIYLKRLGQVVQGKIALILPNGKILAASFPEKERDSFLSPSILSDIYRTHEKTGKNQITLQTNHGGVPLHLVSRKLLFQESGQALYLLLSSSLESLDHAKKKVAMAMVLSGLSAFILAALVTTAVIRKTGSFMDNILTVTQKIAKGGFGTRVKPSDIKEFDTLADSINQMSETLKDYEKKLIASAHRRSADKITAAMAHEIKNPLSSMKMLVQLIEKKTKKDPETGEMVSVLISEINRVDNLVSDLRTLSDPAVVKLSDADPVDVMSQVIAAISPKLEHLNIQMEVSSENHINHMKMDRDKIKQVLWNLIMNGAESMPRGGKLSIFLKNNRTSQCVEYHIEDNGPGIDESRVDDLFEPFYTTKAEGIGIGLNISREIALAHKGDLTLSRSDKGTLATLSIPYQ